MKRQRHEHGGGCCLSSKLLCVATQLFFVYFVKCRVFRARGPFEQDQSQAGQGIASTTIHRFHHSHHSHRTLTLRILLSRDNLIPLPFFPVSAIASRTESEIGQTTSHLRRTLPPLHSSNTTARYGALHQAREGRRRYVGPHLVWLISYKTVVVLTRTAIQGPTESCTKLETSAPTLSSRLRRSDWRLRTRVCRVQRLERSVC